MSHLAGRQAEGNVMRNEYGVLGGFEETGREEVKKDVSKIAAKADKPDFFMGGCGPTVPTGPKRKLRNSWMSKSPAEESNDPPRVEHVPKPLKKWTPVKKKALPPRSKTHDGSVNPLATRGGKKSPFNKKKEEADDKPKEKEPKKEEEKAPKKEEEPPQKRSVSPLRSSAPASSAPAVEEVTTKPATPPPKENPKPKEAEKPAPAVETPAASGDAKDAEIASLKAEIEKLKQEKGSLARDLKKSKGAAGMNKELKEEIFELKQQLKKSGTKDENAKGFHKLENKLNTLKMILDGKVNKNSLEDLQEHVSMVNMIINQDLRKEGMKNVWA